MELGFRSQAAIDAEEKSELERAERVRKLSERPEKREKVDGEASPRTVVSGGDESANVRVSTQKLQPPPVSHSGTLPSPTPNLNLDTNLSQHEFYC